jgi:hypothetical protein
MSLPKLYPREKAPSSAPAARRKGVAGEGIAAARIKRSTERAGGGEASAQGAGFLYIGKLTSLLNRLRGI